MFHPLIRIFLFFLLPLFVIGESHAEKLFQGLEHEIVYLKEFKAFHILKIDPQFFTIVSKKAENETLETVATIANRYHAIAAVNGGFFKMEGEFAHLPMGILKIDNEWIATPHKPRGAIGWSTDDSQVLFDQVLTRVTGLINQEPFLIDGINRIRADNQLILYNRFFYPIYQKQEGIEFLIKDNSMDELIDNLKLINGDLVLSIGPIKTPLFSNFPVRSNFDWDVQVIPQSIPAYTHSDQWKKMTYIVGGTPILVREGEFLTDFSSEQTLPSFLHTPYARTAVGILPNGHFVFVIAEAITIPDLALFMHHIGCVEALNLDGGGSSTMVLNQEILSFTHTEDESGIGFSIRKVSDAILVIPK